MKCPICDSPDTTRFLITNKYIRQTIFGVAILQCSDCDFLFADFIHPEVLNYFYRNFCRNSMSTEDFNTLRENGKINGKSQLTTLKPYLPERIGRVLDFGGGNGEAARLYLPLADEVYITESDPKCIAAIKEEPRLQLIDGDNLMDDKYIGFFDLVIFSNVLEHMSHPVRRIQDFSRILSKGGLLFIEVPNEGVTVQNGGWFCSQHICYYTLSSLQNLLKKQGSFDVEDIRTCGPKIEDILASGQLLHDPEAQNTPNGYEMRAILKNNRPKTETIDMNIDMGEVDQILADMSEYVFTMTHAEN